MENAMRELRLVVGIALLLSMAACIDSGPMTESQVRQDINSTTWSRNLPPPVLPSLQPPAAASIGPELAVP
jgi:hypothetical protein